LRSMSPLRATTASASFSSAIGTPNLPIRVGAPANTINIDTQFFRSREFGAHSDAEPISKLGRLAPAHIGARHRGLPERQELLARAAGIVGDDDIVAIERCASGRESPGTG